MAQFLLDPKVAVERYESLKKYGTVWYNLKTNPEVGAVLEKRTKATFVATGIGNLHRLKDTKRAVMLLQGLV